MVAAGLIGGPGRGQGRKPKAQSANAEVAELAGQETVAIRKAYAAGLRSKNERTALMTAERLLAAELRERDRDDEREVRKLHGEALTLAFIEEARKLGIELPFIESTAEEVDPDSRSHRPALERPDRAAAT